MLTTFIQHMASGIHGSQQTGKNILVKPNSIIVHYQYNINWI